MSPIPENSTGVGWSACTYVSGDFVSGLTECKAKCLRESTCNLINFCPEGATCTYSPNYCDLRNCDGDDYKIDGSTYGAGEIYHKVNGKFDTFSSIILLVLWFVLVWKEEQHQVSWHFDWFYRVVFWCCTKPNGRWCWLWGP